MSDPVPQTEDDETPEKSGMFSTLLKKGLAVGGDGMAKGTVMLKHSLGLGHQPNVIPPDEANINCDLRTVEIGWHPVGGFGGKWFAESTGLGKKITEEIHKYPDPTQHWGVLVGNYVHQLWMDENLDVIYINEQLKPAEWHTFEVGKTRFNDEALRQAGEMTIHNMRSKRAAYNLISNNCQNFAVYLLDAVSIGAHREFATSFAVYQRATGKGTIRDLFLDKHPEEQAEHYSNEQIEGGMKPELQHANTVQTAQQVMDEHTTKIDNHRRVFPA